MTDKKPLPIIYTRLHGISAYCSNCGERLGGYDEEMLQKEDIVKCPKCRAEYRVPTWKELEKLGYV